jgi:anaerobic selenocysteine-containing dehydrogenase
VDFVRGEVIGPVYRQITGSDPLVKAAAAQAARSRSLSTRPSASDRVVTSVCPYCGVGCSQKVYVRDEKVVQIAGNPDSPVSRGRLATDPARTGDGHDGGPRHRHSPWALAGGTPRVVLRIRA